MKSLDVQVGDKSSINRVIASLLPEDIFDESVLARYKQYHEDIWHRLIRLHETIVTLEKLKEFPFDVAEEFNGFWSIVIGNFVDVATISLHSLLNDTRSNTHTLRSFKNFCINSTWRHDSEKDQLKALLRPLEPDNHITERVRRVRNCQIAHRLKENQTGDLEKELSQIPLSEFRSLFKYADAVFQALSFGREHPTLSLDMIPSTIGGNPTRNPVDMVLDAVLKDSYFVSRPEKRKEYWHGDRKRIPNEQLLLMNELRCRVGLPEA